MDNLNSCSNFEYHHATVSGRNNPGGHPICRTYLLHLRPLRGSNDNCENAVMHETLCLATVKGQGSLTYNPGSCGFGQRTCSTNALLHDQGPPAVHQKTHDELLQEATLVIRGRHCDGTERNEK